MNTESQYGGQLIDAQPRCCSQNFLHELWTTLKEMFCSAINETIIASRLVVLSDNGMARFCSGKGGEGRKAGLVVELLVVVDVDVAGSDSFFFLIVEKRGNNAGFVFLPKSAHKV